MKQPVDSAKKDRIRKELIDAGMSNYGLMKAESRHLAEALHDDEHIGGVVYGRHSQSGSAMLVATNNRVIFLDYKLLFKKFEEMSYDMVGGISVNEQELYSGVVLHTRLGDYELRYVNTKLAKKFAKFIESKRLEGKDRTKSAVELKQPSQLEAVNIAEFTKEASQFLTSHELGVLSTVDEVGAVHGAAVYYAVDQHNHMYLVTKSQTRKARNILIYPQIAITIYDADALQTMQIHGVARVESDMSIAQRVYTKIVKPRLQGKNLHMPPITKIPAGQYQIISITPTEYKLSDYNNV